MSSLLQIMEIKNLLQNNPYESIKTTEALIRIDRLDGQRNYDAQITIMADDYLFYTSGWCVS